MLNSVLPLVIPIYFGQSKPVGPTTDPARSPKQCPAMAAQTDYERKPVVEVVCEVQWNRGQHEEHPALQREEEIEPCVKEAKESEEGDPDEKQRRRRN